MENVRIGDATLVAEVTGSGEPVLLIHGSILPGSFARLVNEPALGNYQLITYSRRGFPPSSMHSGPFSITQQAEDAAAVLRHFGIDRAHIAGHSYGGATALQLALDAPDLVESLILLEPALMVVPSAEAFAATATPAAEAYMGGDRASAIDIFMQVVGGPRYRELLDPVFGTDWFDHAVAISPTFFEVEFPALAEWTFGEDQVRQITKPATYVLGSESAPIFPETAAAFQEWIGTPTIGIDGANHFLQMTHPEPIASGIAGFLARHPMKATAQAAGQRS